MGGDTAILLPLRKSFVRMGLRCSRERPPTGPTASVRLRQVSTSALHLPKRIVLIRHGESLGNSDPSAYGHTPDWEIPLTMRGIEQSRALGRELKERVGEDPIFVYCSPYQRTRETLKYVMEPFESNKILGAREEPRIAEQQFGNFQKAEKMANFKSDRNNFGRFYYRFPEGEAGLDVFNRVTGFIATLFRDWSKIDPEKENNMTVIVVTHGLTLRLFLMRWFHFTVEEFEISRNPPNAGYVCLNREPTGDVWYPHAFRISERGLSLCNFPNRTYDPEHGRRYLTELVAVDSPSARPLHTVDSKE